MKAQEIVDEGHALYILTSVGSAEKGRKSKKIEAKKFFFTGLETGCKPVLFELAPRLWSRFLFPESEKTKRKLHTLQHKDSNDRQLKVQRYDLL